VGEGHHLIMDRRLPFPSGTSSVNNVVVALEGDDLGVVHEPVHHGGGDDAFGAQALRR
jgi:hypothetical protein